LPLVSRNTLIHPPLMTDQVPQLVEFIRIPRFDTTSYWPLCSRNWRGTLNDLLPNLKVRFIPRNRRRYIPLSGMIPFHRVPSGRICREQIIVNNPQQRPFRVIWRISRTCSSTHFFRGRILSQIINPPNPFRLIYSHFAATALGLSYEFKTFRLASYE
jgi:hypothetical protein